MATPYYPPQGGLDDWYPPQGVPLLEGEEVPTPPTPPPPPWGGNGLAGWDRRKSLVITGSTVGAQTNYQVKITVHKGEGVDSGEHVYCGGNCRDDFGDIRFTKSDKVTLLDYWMMWCVSGDYAIFWVEVDSIPISPNTVTIYVYYDAPPETTTSSGTDTFVFFDDFLGSALDLSKWDLIGGASPTVADSIATFVGTGTRSQVRTDNAWINWTSTKGNRLLVKLKVNVAQDLYDADVEYGQWTWNKFLRLCGSWTGGNRMAGGGNGGSGSSNSEFLTGGAVTDFRWYQIIRKQNSTPYARVYDGETLGWQQTNAGYFITDTNCYIWIRGDNETGQNWILDWVAVAIYVDPAPAYTSWSEEEED